MSTRRDLGTFQTVTIPDPPPLTECEKAKAMILLAETATRIGATSDELARVYQLLGLTPTTKDQS